MHQLMHLYLQLPDHPSYIAHPGAGAGFSGGGGGSGKPILPVIYQRIKDMQDILLTAVKAHDPLIQEKIAELALTGER